jgi:mono/diheme cytochrome c family protein
MEGQIMRAAKLLASCIFATTLLLLAPLTRSFAAAQPSKQDKQSRPEPVRDGDTVFRQNCARCHTAPDAFPRQITTAVVRHMRVRANLSEEDARALLKFFNP